MNRRQRKKQISRSLPKLRGTRFWIYRVDRDVAIYTARPKSIGGKQCCDVDAAARQRKLQQAVNSFLDFCEGKED
jgi:hypothetical protein